jgi:hypothetical protein
MTVQRSTFELCLRPLGKATLLFASVAAMA